MGRSNFEKNVWKYIFPVLSVILWIFTIVFFFRSHQSYSTNDVETQYAIMNAMRWLPACFIGAVISSAAAYVVAELQSRFDK